MKRLPHLADRIIERVRHRHFDMWSLGRQQVLIVDGETGQRGALTDVKCTLSPARPGARCPN
jgi:hypothetical protein